MIDYETNADTIIKVKQISDKLEDEKNGKVRTKLMFDQLLRGLYINQFN